MPEGGRPITEIRNEVIIEGMKQERVFRRGRSSNYGKGQGPGTL